MSNQPPNIAGYTGSLAGGPVVLNPQADHGFVADYTVLVPTGGGTGFTMTLPNGNTLAVPTGVLLQLPGPLGAFTLTQIGLTAVDYIVYVSAGVGNQPTLVVASGGGGGGGGGGAPTTAPYLLNGSSVDPALTAGVAIGALPFEKLRFAFPTDPGGDLTNVLFPMESAIDLTNGHNVGTGGGVGHIFQLTDALHPGGIDVGTIRFAKVAGADHYDMQITGIGGESLMTLNSLNGTYSSGITFNGEALLRTTGSANLVLQTVNGNTLIRCQTHDVVKFGVGSITLQEAGAFTGLDNVTVEAATGKSLTLTTDGGQTGIGIDDSIAACLQIIAGGNQWTFDFTFGDLSGPGSQAAEIKNIHDATADTSVPTWGQVKGYTGFTPRDTVPFGATTTGVTSNQLHLLYGPPYAAAKAPSDTDTVFPSGSNGMIMGGKLLAITDPAGVGPQVFTIYKNGAPTTWTATAPVAFVGTNVNFVNSGADVTFNAGDFLQVVSDVGSDVTDVGALTVSAFLYLAYS